MFTTNCVYVYCPSLSFSAQHPYLHPREWLNPPEPISCRKIESSPVSDNHRRSVFLIRRAKTWKQTDAIPTSSAWDPRALQRGYQLGLSLSPNHPASLPLTVV
ncbi:unnamed protein product [Arctogadus glacialis]